ncbi:hypothetical protein TSAR_013946, partial [Trichomalopsis sarcophagae]
IETIRAAAVSATTTAYNFARRSCRKVLASKESETRRAERSRETIINIFYVHAWHLTAASARARVIYLCVRTNARRERERERRVARKIFPYGNVTMYKIGLRLDSRVTFIPRRQMYSYMKRFAPARARAHMLLQSAERAEKAIPFYPSTQHRDITHPHPSTYTQTHCKYIYIYLKVDVLV